MANSRTYQITVTAVCAANRCGSTTIFLHARLRGAAVLFHWCCFLRQMRESSQQNPSKTPVEEPQSPLFCKHRHRLNGLDAH